MLKAFDGMVDKRARVITLTLKVIWVVVRTDCWFIWPEERRGENGTAEGLLKSMKGNRRVEETKIAGRCGVHGPCGKPEKSSIPPTSFFFWPPSKRHFFLSLSFPLIHSSLSSIH